MRNKIVDAAEAVAIIRSGDTVASSGFVGVGTPDEIIMALEKRFVETGEPRELTLVFAAAPGDGADRGLNRLAHPGMIKRLIGGHFGLVPKLARMAVDNHVEAYNLPLGCVSHLFREIAGRKAGLLSKVGLGTFVDPTNGGGKLNNLTTEDLVRSIEIDGEPWLFYKAFAINVAIIRGTTADRNGNISMEKEALTLDSLALATAAKNCKGFVVAQVERIAAPGSLNPRHVKIPSVLVDCVVVSQPENHAQTYATGYNGAFSGELRAPVDRNVPMSLDNRKIIARRCALELPMGGVVNLGIGMPEGIASVAAEEKLFDFVTLTAEPGIIGGIPQGGLDFGAAINAESIIDQNQMFDFYDGGGLDLACLGMAQVNASGDVNVSLFNGRLAGAGGFINISQNARKLIFAGTFTTGGLKTTIEQGKLEILTEGKSPKFVAKVDQITFSGELAANNAQPVLYVTERCVFELTPQGLALTEVAPGIDIERDILAHMEFRPIVLGPRAMDAALFSEASMQLYDRLLNRPLSDRLSFDEKRNTLFLGLDGYRVHGPEDVEAVREAVFNVFKQVRHRFSAIINYDSCDIAPDMADDWFSMAAEVERVCYDHVSRYTTSAFMRLKLGEALTGRRVAPHIFETHAEARKSAQRRQGG
jgi:propionate CoA-transferase